MNFWQCLVLYLISIQERVTKTNCFRSLIQIILKTKESKYIFYFKSKLNQVAFPNWQLLHEVSENAILHSIIC